MPFDIEAARTTLKDVQHHAAADLHERIAALATPRMTGTDAAADTDQALTETFEALGYATRELPFSFSTWPGRFGATAAGVALALTGAGAGALLYSRLPVPALVVLVVGLGLAMLPLLTLGPSLRKVPFGRVESRNLLFTRPGARPSWIVMAHRDSKSQLIPTLVRTAAIAVGAAGWLALLFLAALWFTDEVFRFPGGGLVAGIVVAVAGLVLALAWSSNESPGALDNATGVAALLAVAGGDPGDEVAFLLTDGEEMGLAGARAAVRSIPPVQGVINVDGLDDRGVIHVAEGHGWRRRGTAPQLAAALLTAAEALNVYVERRPLPRYLLVDHLPFAAAGIPSLTVLRGHWRSLLRVHRPGDSADRLDGRGAAETATVLAAALRLLRENQRDHLAARGAPGS